MKHLWPLVAALVLAGCTAKPGSKDLHYLNGYWEIKEVRLPNGEKKAYGVNTTLEYWEVKGSKGLRTKVAPKLNGRFTASTDALPFTVAQNDTGLFLNYTKDGQQWREQITALGPKKLTLVNHDGITYIYQRFTPMGTTP